MAIRIDELSTPIGTLTAAVRDGGRLCLLHFSGTFRDAAAARERPARSEQRRVLGVRDQLARWYPGEAVTSQPVPDVGHAVAAYFQGDLAAIDGLDVELNGTPFQRQVWLMLRNVRAGEPVSYGALARMVGAPAAVRAVGAANGANPIPLVLPCHRIIGANGSLTGYGGGLSRKRWLLGHEAEHGHVGAQRSMFA